MLIGVVLTGLIVWFFSDVEFSLKDNRVGLIELKGSLSAPRIP